MVFASTVVRLAILWTPVSLLCECERFAKNTHSARIALNLMGASWIAVQVCSARVDTAMKSPIEKPKLILMSGAMCVSAFSCTGLQNVFMGTHQQMATPPRSRFEAENPANQTRWSQLNTYTVHACKALKPHERTFVQCIDACSSAHSTETYYPGRKTPWP